MGASQKVFDKANFLKIICKFYGENNRTSLSLLFKTLALKVFQTIYRLF